MEQSMMQMVTWSTTQPMIWLGRKPDSMAGGAASSAANDTVPVAVGRMTAITADGTAYGAAGGAENDPVEGSADDPAGGKAGNRADDPDSLANNLAVERGLRGGRPPQWRCLPGSLMPSS